VFLSLDVCKVEELQLRPGCVMLCNERIGQIHCKPMSRNNATMPEVSSAVTTLQICLRGMCGVQQISSHGGHSAAGLAGPVGRSLGAALASACGLNRETRAFHFPASDEHSVCVGRSGDMDGTCSPRPSMGDNESACGPCELLELPLRIRPGLMDAVRNLPSGAADGRRASPAELLLRTCSLRASAILAPRSTDHVHFSGGSPCQHRPRQDAECIVSAPIAATCDTLSMTQNMGSLCQLSCADAQPRVNAYGHGDVTSWQFTAQTGSFGYMAPEVIQGKPYNASVDIFAMGVVMLELFSGRIVSSHFADAAALQRYTAGVVAGRRLPMPNKFPPMLRDIVDEAWHQDPSARPTAAQLVQMLCDFGASSEFDEYAGVEPRGCMPCLYSWQAPRFHELWERQ
jgi:Protein kinase domain